MYFIAGALCLCDHRSLPCNATEIYCWLLRDAILCCFVAIHHRRHRFLRCGVPSYALCCHPCNQQRTKCLIVASSRLAMVSLLSSHAPWQYDCFLQYQKYYVIASLALQHQGYSCCHCLLRLTAYNIWLLHFIIKLQLLAYCNFCIVVLLFAPSWYDVKKMQSLSLAHCNMTWKLQWLLSLLHAINSLQITMASYSRPHDTTKQNARCCCFLQYDIKNTLSCKWRHEKNRSLQKDEATSQQLCVWRAFLTSFLLNWMAWYRKKIGLCKTHCLMKAVFWIQSVLSVLLSRRRTNKRVVLPK